MATRTFYKGDCLEMVKKNVKDESLDLIYTDPPFASTANWWDESLNWKELFNIFFQKLKPNGMIVLHCSIPFNYVLIREAPCPPNYTWYWKKTKPTNHLNVNREPMRIVEEILVWKKGKGQYFQQRNGREKRIQPAQLPRHSTYWNSKAESTEAKEVIGFARHNFYEKGAEERNFSTRPLELIELMIKSYSKENDTILDFTCYRGISGEVANKLNRNWIGIDKYFEPDYKT
jgi:DNA modification methylase